MGAAGERDRERGVERDADAAQPLFAEESLIDQGIFGLGQRVEMPAIEVADLLAELADVRPDPARQSAPVDVALLDPHFLVLEGHVDLGLRERIEVRLKGELELPGHRVVSRRTLVAGDEADIAGGADLGVQQVGAPTARGPRCRIGGCGCRRNSIARRRPWRRWPPPGRLAGGGAKRGELVGGVARRLRRYLTGGRLRGAGPATGLPHLLQSRAEPAEGCRQAVGPRLAGHLRSGNRSSGRALPRGERVQPGADAVESRLKRIGATAGRLLCPPDAGRKGHERGRDAGRFQSVH